MCIDITLYIQFDSVKYILLSVCLKYYIILSMSYNNIIVFSFNNNDIFITS